MQYMRNQTVFKKYDLVKYVHRFIFSKFFVKALTWLRIHFPAVFSNGEIFLRKKVLI